MIFCPGMKIFKRLSGQAFDRGIMIADFKDGWKDKKDALLESLGGAELNRPRLNGSR